MTNSITPTPFAGAVHHDERRKTGRITTSLPALLRFPDRLQTIQGGICDLSVGGTGFICPQAVAAQSRCSLQFTLPMLHHQPAQPVNVQAMVVHSMQVVGNVRQFRVNLQFTALPPTVRNHIEALIRQSLSSG